MSEAPSAHAGHDDHAFTGEPVDELPPDEPRSPSWLPALGVVFFTAAAVALIAGGSDDAKAAPSAEPTVKVVPVAAPAPVAPMQRPAGAGAPGGQGAPGAAPQLTPEQQAILRKAMAQQAPGAGAPPGPPAVRRPPAPAH